MLLGEATFNCDLDVLAVSNHFLVQDSLREEPDVTPMKLQKLLYLAQANFLASTGRRLFDERIEAYMHGPVAYRAWQSFTWAGNQIICAAREQGRRPLVDDGNLPSDAKDFVEQIWQKYKHYSASELRHITHEQAPWRDHYSQAVHRPVIPDVEMMEYFQTKIPAAERVLHPAVVAVPEGFVDDLDEREFLLRASEFFA